LDDIYDVQSHYNSALITSRIL